MRRLGLQTQRIEALQIQVARSLGLDAQHAINAAMLLLIQHPPVLIVGPSGCGQLEMAKAAHAASGRGGEFVAVTEPGEATVRALRRANSGTVFVDLDRAGSIPRRARNRERNRLSSELARALLGWDRDIDVRPIFAARTRAVACRSLGVVAAEGTLIEVQPLSSRPREVGRIADQMLEEYGDTARLADLKLRLKACSGGSWPNNLETLEDFIPFLSTVISTGSIRKACHLLGIGVSTGHYRFRQVLGVRLSKTTATTRRGR